MAGRRPGGSDDWRRLGCDAEVGEDLADRVALEDRGEQLAVPAAVVADEYVQTRHALDELGARVGPTFAGLGLGVLRLAV